MEKIEHQARINESINESVKREEQRVIEAANRRMAEVHAKKAEEANRASKEIESAHAKRKSAIDNALRDEERSIADAVRSHSDAVVA